MCLKAGYICCLFFPSDSSLLQDNVAFVLCLDTLGNGDSLHLHVSKPPKEGTPQYSLLKELEAVRSQTRWVLEQLRRITFLLTPKAEVTFFCLPPRWLRVSIQRSSSPWSTRKSTWLTTCWRGSTNVLGSAACPPSLCPTCPRTGWLSAPASWTCGQCPPPLATERESPLLGGFITAVSWITKK